MALTQSAEPRRNIWKSSSNSLHMSESIPGWTRGKEALELARISLSLAPGAVIIEIGAFFGSGTVLLAGPRKIKGSGSVHAVDPFDCSGDVYSVPVYRKILANAGGSLRAYFDENIRRAGLIDWVEVHQGHVAKIAMHWTTPVDMLFLDGDQSRSGAREAYDSWSPFLKADGVIAIHNSSPDNFRPDHDGNRCLVEQEIYSPRYCDIFLVGSTTFARKI
jgi:predicted O-methyltransferase YrrM